MTTFYAGDRPVEPLVVVSSDLDLALYDGAAAALLDETRAHVADLPASIVRTEDEYGGQVRSLEVTWPEATPLAAPGLYWLRVTATTTEGARRRLPLTPLIVQAEDGWYNLDDARESDWPDARDLDDLALWSLLETAKGDVLAYAPTLAAGVPVPLRYRAAQLMQAKNRHNAAITNPSNGEAGIDGFAVTIFPLDWQVKQLLRPTEGVPPHA